MNANSKQPVPTTINDWLASATADMQRANIPSARLDAELILCHMLGVDRTWLIAHGGDSLTLAALSQKGGERRSGLKEYGEKLLRRRLNREPLAYLFGRKEFYGREFIVTPDVLIPRPESEALIELAKKHGLHGRLLDVGCGSGALGLTLWYELKDLSLIMSDFSAEALEVAKKNAKKLSVKPVRYVESDLLEHWLNHADPKSFDAIVANLPYVDKSWERSPETNHEPKLALFASEGGLALIQELIEQTPQVLAENGYLLLEADPLQHEAISQHGKNHHFETVEIQDYAILLRHSTNAEMPQA